MKGRRIIVVGAGPVGVVAALACAQKGFAVTVIESEKKVEDSPRAATTHPATLEMIERLGLIDQFIAQGLVARYFQFWDRPTRTLVAEFDHELLRDETPFPFVVQTEQHKLANMGIARLREFADARITFGTRAIAVRQDSSSVTVTVEGSNGREDLSADYLIGADGGRSTIRKGVEIEFEGYTFPEHFLTLTVLDDFQGMMPCCYRNYFADPLEWVNLFKVAGDDGKGRWRAVFPTRTDESDEEALNDDAIHARLQRAFPIAKTYDVVHRNLYKVHQRVAAKFRMGRIFLAGDAAHVNNTIGGLGLNSGIHDAMELAETIHLVETGQADESLFDRYERRRRPLNIEFVQQTTINNKRRLEERDPKARQANLDELRATAEDPKRHKQFLMRSSLIDSVRKAERME
jgi:2-polyprenyl-6-methoxyphenol hydroxylase-like FAD-dependent oxidoreductase